MADFITPTFPLTYPEFPPDLCFLGAVLSYERVFADIVLIDFAVEGLNLY